MKYKSRVLGMLINKFRPNVHYSDSDFSEVLGWYFRFGAKPLIRGFLFQLLRGRDHSPQFLGKKCQILYPKLIQIGSGSKFGDYCYVTSLTQTGINIGSSVTIGNFAIIQGASSPLNPGERLVIGNNSYIGPRANIGIGGQIEIGEHCQIGSDFIAVSENHGISKEGIPTLDFVTRKGISIGNNCWIGHRVTVLDGVSIGDNSIIGAGAVVTKSFPENSVIAGVPAKQIER